MAIPDYKINGLWAKTGKLDGKKRNTFSYDVWYQMMQRCKVGGVSQTRFPTYVGCTTSKLFSDFQNFTEWHVSQIGYNLPNYQLDKDILSQGNKVYSEDNCVLVPRELNFFLVDNAARRGKFPQGVSWHIHHNKYAAQCSSKGVIKHLGYFSDIVSASSAYKSFKENEAYDWYMKLSSGEYVVDSRVTERMRTWSHNKEKNDN